MVVEERERRGFQVVKEHMKRPCGRKEQGALKELKEAGVAGAQPGVCDTAQV